MENLTTKELSALEDQIGFEQMMHCKYQSAQQESADENLKACYGKYAQQHQQNFDTLLNYLK